MEFFYLIPLRYACYIAVATLRWLHCGGYALRYVQGCIPHASGTPFRWRSTLPRYVLHLAIHFATQLRHRSSALAVPPSQFRTLRSVTHPPPAPRQLSTIFFRSLFPSDLLRRICSVGFALSDLLRRICSVGFAPSDLRGRLGQDAPLSLRNFKRFFAKSPLPLRFHEKFLKPKKIFRVNSVYIPNIFVSLQNKY